MEYIQGGRVDDLVYLSDHNIDRNTVALELARIFCQMVHINGWFHAVSSPPFLGMICSPHCHYRRTRIQETCSYDQQHQARSHRTTSRSCSSTTGCTSTSTPRSG